VVCARAPRCHCCLPCACGSPIHHIHWPISLPKVLILSSLSHSLALNILKKNPVFGSKTTSDKSTTHFEPLTPNVCRWTTSNTIVMDVIYHFFSWSVPGKSRITSNTLALGFQAPNPRSFDSPFLLNPPVLTDHPFSLRAMVPLNLLHFFTGVGPARGGVIRRQEPRPPKVCKLCSYVDFLISVLLSYDKQREIWLRLAPQ